jgi:CBS domain-containing protein
MPPTTDVLAAIRIAAAHPETRVIGVTDDEGRLVGVVPILRLAEAAVARAAPEAIMSSLIELDEIAAFSHAIEARTLGEAMLAPAAIAPTATIDEGFRRMHERHLSGIYVVDEEGRPVGYLDLLELALVYAQALEVETRSGGDDPGDKR